MATSEKLDTRYAGAMEIVGSPNKREIRICDLEGELVHQPTSLHRLWRGVKHSPFIGVPLRDLKGILVRRLS